MVFLAWVFAVGLLFLFFSGVLDKLDNPNRYLIESPQGSTLLLEANRQGHYLLPGRINGIEVNLLLDTGATDVAVPESIAIKAGLPKLAQVHSSTANGLTTGWLTQVDELMLGSLRISHVRATILPNMAGNEALLGMNVLRHFELTQKDGRLSITVPSKH